jgi:hypothetical protein
MHRPYGFRLGASTPTRAGGSARVLERYTGTWQGSTTGWLLTNRTMLM